MPRGRNINRNVNPDTAPASSRRYGAVGANRDDRPLRWSDVDGAAIAACVKAVTSVGDAILFGTVTGGGALVVTVFSGSEKHPTYARSCAEAEQFLADFENVASDMR